MSLIRNNNGITLRLEKSTSLTFDEMDQNFSSFFYSASTVQANDTNKLRLYYTGSNELGTGFEADRYMEVFLPTSTTTNITNASIDPPGEPSQITFHGTGENENQFAASGNLVFKDNRSFGVGLADPNTPIEITSPNAGTPSAIKIRSNTANGSCEYTKGYFEVERNGDTLFRLGKTTAGGSGEGADNTHLFSRYTIELGYSDFSGNTARNMRINGNGTIIGSDISANQNAVSELTVAGTFSTAPPNDIKQATISKFRHNSVPTSLLPTTRDLPVLSIESPLSTEGGTIVAAINTNNASGKCDTSFTVVSGQSGTMNRTVATFKADGNVGIGQRFPVEKLQVEGNISGSGNFQIQGTATVKTIDAGSGAGTNALITTAAGVLQKLDAAPVPKGGIIMWSGGSNNVPDGWRLCAGGSENGVDIPDLRERFIVGAGGNNTTNSVSGTSGYDDNAIGGLNEKLITACQIPLMTTSRGSEHTHTYKDTMYTEEGGNFDYKSAIDNVDRMTTSRHRNSKTDTTSGGLYSYSINRTTGGEDQHTHSVGTPYDDQLGFDVRPPYYALAFIIYVGT